MRTSKEDNRCEKVVKWLTNIQPNTPLNKDLNQNKDLVENSSVDCLSQSDEVVSNSSLKQYFNHKLDLDEVQDLNTKDFKGMTVEDVVKFRLVLSRNVFGMSLDEFSNTYYETYGKELSKYHFGSIIEMIYSLNKVFALQTIDNPNDYRLPKDDIFGKLIHDARHPFFSMEEPVKRIKLEKKSIPKSEQVFWFNLIREEGNDIHFDRYSVDWKDFGFDSKIEFFERLSQLIPISVDKELKLLNLKPLSEIQEFISDLMVKRNRNFLRNIAIPYSDVVAPGIQIPILPVEDLFKSLKDKIRAVYISNVLSYKKFYGVLIEDDFFQMWQTMDETYARVDSREYQVPKEFVVSGYVCAVKSKQNGWIRAQVIETHDFGTETKIKCKSLDLGYNLKVEYSKLKLLMKEFAQLSVRCLRFHLNGVQNAKKFRKSVYKFRAQREKTPKDELFCQFVGLRDQSLEVIVFETDDLYGYYSIGNHLIEKNFAEKTNDFVEPNFEKLFESVQQFYNL